MVFGEAFHLLLRSNSVLGQGIVYWMAAVILLPALMVTLSKMGIPELLRKPGVRTKRTHVLNNKITSSPFPNSELNLDLHIWGEGESGSGWNNAKRFFPSLISVHPDHYSIVMNLNEQKVEWNNILGKRGVCCKWG